MRKLFKKSLSFLMVLAVLFTCTPYSSAVDETNLQTQSITEFSGGSGLNPLVSNLSEDTESGYSVVSVEMDGKTATVELNNKTACTLVVAVYEEGSSHMLGCAVEDIEASAGTVNATVDVDTLPEYYIAKAYLLNSGYTSLSGEEYLLCEPYTYNGKTKAYEQFLAKEPEDFSGDNILVFDDEKERTDFAVFTDDVIRSDDSDEIEFTYNEETSTYTFTKAPDDLSSLEAGDIYYYQYGEATNEFLLFKVKSVTVSGSEVTVQADTDLGIGEAFTFVRIDADADFSGIDDSDMEFGSGYTQVEENGEIALMGESVAHDKFVYATALSINFNLGPAASFSAEIGFAASAGSRLYYDIQLFGAEFYDFKSSYSFTLNILSYTVTGKISLPSDKYKIESPAIPVGPFGLTFSVVPVIEFSGSASGSIKYVNTVVITADNTRGVNRMVDEDHNLDFPSFDKEFVFKIGLRVDIKLGLKELVNLKLDPSAIVQFSGDPDTVGVNDDTHHSCKICIEGEANLAVGGSLSLNITIIPEKMEFSWNIISLVWTFNLYDFYISKTEQGVKFGTGKCPNIAYKAIINILDESGKEISGATVACASGICDSDEDGVFAETSTANIFGVAVFYLKTGYHSISVVHPKYTTQNTTINMLAAPKSFNITMQEKKRGEVIVTVKDTNGSVLSGVGVSVSGCGENEGEEYAATTGYDGYVTFNLFPGEYNVTASKQEYNSNTLNSVTVKNGTCLEIVLAPQGVILFGSYPQSEVTDNATIRALNSLSLNWISYGYYSGTGEGDGNGWSNGEMQSGDWMKYADVTYNGTKYRAVKFTQYRPSRTGDQCSASNSDQYYFGYETNVVYWFKYEPLKWRMVNGILLCDSVIDGQPYSNFVNYIGEEDKYLNDVGLSANDYETSSIRKWLNTAFYNTAFTAEEKQQIASANDSVFLLSYDEVDGTGIKPGVKSTAYARSQGGYNSQWWLRTPSGFYEFAAGYVCYDGTIDGLLYPSPVNTNRGVRPAIRLAVLPTDVDLTTSDEFDLEINSGLQMNTATEQSSEIRFTADACMPNRQYVLLNVTGYGSDFKLSTDNLYYIDTVTADESGVVCVNFTQKQLAENSTTLLIGDFGSGVETLIIKTEVNIEDPSVTTINYGDTLVLYATFKYLPEGATILWTVEGSGVTAEISDDGLTCSVTSVQNGNVTVKATVVDENEEPILGTDGNEITAEKKINSKVNFWLKIVSFFKNLFGINRIIY